MHLPQAFVISTLTLVTLSHGLPNDGLYNILATRDAGANAEEYIDADLYTRDALSDPEPEPEAEAEAEAYPDTELGTIYPRSPLLLHPRVSPKQLGYERIPSGPPPTKKAQATTSESYTLHCDPTHVRLTGLMDPQLGPQPVINCLERVKCVGDKVKGIDPKVWGVHVQFCKRGCSCRPSS